MCVCVWLRLSFIAPVIYHLQIVKSKQRVAALESLRSRPAISASWTIALAKLSTGGHRPQVMLSTMESQGCFG